MFVRESLLIYLGIHQIAEQVHVQLLSTSMDYGSPLTLMTTCWLFSYLISETSSKTRRYLRTHVSEVYDVTFPITCAQLSINHRLLIS